MNIPEAVLATQSKVTEGGLVPHAARRAPLADIVPHMSNLFVCCTMAMKFVLKVAADAQVISNEDMYVATDASTM